jgi:acyl dehydratase
MALAQFAKCAQFGRGVLKIAPYRLREPFVVGSREFESIEELRRHVDEEIAVSDWITIDAERAGRFAAVCGEQRLASAVSDRRDPTPLTAAMSGAMLSLSLLPWLAQRSIVIHGTRLGINYGLNRVRFPAPLTLGNRLRGRFKLLGVETLAPLDGMAGVQLTWEVTIESDAGGEPLCVAESVSRRYG